MASKEDVMNVLKECYDPEIPVNIVDLGLVYDVQLNDGKVFIKMTLTTPACPLGALIDEQIKAKLLKLEGIKEVEVEIVWDPPWNIEKMSPEARMSLGV